LKRIHKFTLILVLIGIPLALAGCASTPSTLKKGNVPEFKKVYLDPAPIQDTPAYKTFLNSSRSEAAKLSYVLDRIKAAKNLTYWFEGESYHWLEAYSGAVWLLWQDHKANEDAHSFIRKEALRFQNPTRPTLIQFPDRSRCLATQVLLNELDLLENAVKQNTHK